MLQVLGTAILISLHSPSPANPGDALITASASMPTVGVEDESKWKDRLPDQDRAAAEAGIGFEAPAFPEGLTWIGGPTEPSMEKLRGKVVVLQSWTCGTSLGRGIPKKLDRSLKDLAKRKDVEVILVHTPQDAEKSARFCARAKLAHPVVVDASGGFCDQLGAFKRPVNVIVDRSGTVRYAGLTSQGAASAVGHLLTLPYDPTITPEPRPKPDPSTTTPRGNYPPITGGPGAASDLRGRKAPLFVVDRWITAEPDARGKVAIIDFWATWCGPCIKAIPHMNDIANQFRGQVECVGVSDESKSAFEAGIEKKNLKGSDFAYALALDPKGRMKSAFNVRGIPFVAVMSTDWVVRWQGHPSSLTASIISSIIAADPGVRREISEPGTPGTPPARWASQAR